jgi:hypothetical protein
MTTEKFLETKTFNIKNHFEGYIIPYGYLKTLLDEYAQIKVNELNKADVSTSFTNADSDTWFIANLRALADMELELMKEGKIDRVDRLKLLHWIAEHL